MPPKSKGKSADREEEGGRATLSRSVKTKPTPEKHETSSVHDEDSDDTDFQSRPGGAAATMRKVITVTSKRDPPPSASKSKSSSKKSEPDKIDDNDETPTSPIDSHVRGADVKWFRDPSYVTPFLMHFRRNTNLARTKRMAHLEEYPPEIRQHTIHPEYYNYDDCPKLGVDNAEMKHYVNDPRDRVEIAPKLIILIGGAAVGKSYTIQQMFPDNNATHIDVDEPKMYAIAMEAVARSGTGKKRWETGAGNGITQRTFLYHIIDGLIENRDDIIIDTTGNMKRPIHYCMAQAKRAGYMVICIAVFAPIEIALERCRQRGATTLREGGDGMVYGSHNPVRGFKDGVLDPSKSLLQHYAVKDKFKKKTDLFFLLDNTPDGDIAKTHGAERHVIDGIPIPAETVVCFKYTKPPGSEVVTTQLVYINTHVKSSVNYYSCHVHQPPKDSGGGKAGHMMEIDPNEILRCRPQNGGNRRTCKLKQNKQTKRKTNRGYHKIKNTRRYRRTLKTGL